MKRTFLTVAAVVLCTSAAHAAKLSLKPYQADANGFNVSSVIVTGDKDAILIDAQFTQADAYRVAADILSTGKKLTTIFVSQGDPDYYFGLEALKKVFPDAKIYAKQSTVDHIKETLPKKMEIWGPKLGANGPKNPIVPEVLAGDSLELEGEKLEIVNLGSDAFSSYVVYIPSLKAVVGGVVVFGDMHLWTADTPTKESRQGWMNMLDKVAAMKPAIVVPGHSKAGIKFDMSQVNFTKSYLVAFEKELPKAKNSAALIAAMKKKYPSAIGDSVLELGAKVNKGEMKW